MTTNGNAVTEMARLPKSLIAGNQNQAGVGEKLTYERVA
jgi:hypothetical protein